MGLETAGELLALHLILARSNLSALAACSRAALLFLQKPL